MKKIQINLGSKLNVFHYLVIFILLIAFSFPFVSGFFSSDAKFEQLSNYITNQVIDNTLSGKYLGISVSKTPDSGEIPGSDDEFHKTYGAFKQTIPTFVSGYNMQKNNQLTIEVIDDCPNLSIIYTGADISVDYDGHYKHGTYPFELMFETPRLYDVSNNMIYLSQSQADIFLQKQGIAKIDGKFSRDDYYTLIKQKFYMNVDGQSKECVICNVYYEFNYYYEATHEIVGDFVLCAYYNPTPYVRENVYFLCNKSYETSYFMSYINAMYSNKKYAVNALTYNFINDTDTDLITVFYYQDYKVNSTFTYIYIVLGILLIAMCCIINYIKCWSNNLKYLLLHLISFIVPYFAFFIVCIINKSVILFSNFSIRLYVYFLIFYVVANLLIYIIERIYKYHLEKKNNAFIDK